MIGPSGDINVIFQNKVFTEIYMQFGGGPKNDNFVTTYYVTVLSSCVLAAYTISQEYDTLEFYSQHYYAYV